MFTLSYRSNGITIFANDGQSYVTFPVRSEANRAARYHARRLGVAVSVVELRVCATCNHPEPVSTFVANECITCHNLDPVAVEEAWQMEDTEDIEERMAQGGGYAPHMTADYFGPGASTLSQDEIALYN